MKSLVVGILLVIALSVTQAQGADIGSAIPFPCDCDNYKCNAGKSCGCEMFGFAVPFPAPPPAPPSSCGPNGCPINTGTTVVTGPIVNPNWVDVSVGTPVATYTTTESYAVSSGGVLTARMSKPFMQRRGPVRGVVRLFGRTLHAGAGCN